MHSTDSAGRDAHFFHRLSLIAMFRQQFFDPYPFFHPIRGMAPTQAAAP
jgi:hypothetical protein